MAGASFVKLLLLLLLAFHASAHAGSARKLLMFPRPRLPGYGYPGNNRPTFGSPGYGYPGYGRPTVGTPPLRQAPPTGGFPGPVIAMDPTQFEVETVAAASGDHKSGSMDSMHSSNVPGKLAQQEEQLME